MNDRGGRNFLCAEFDLLWGKKFLRYMLLIMLITSLASCAWAEYYNEGNNGSSEEKAYIYI